MLNYNAAVVGMAVAESKLRQALPFGKGQYASGGPDQKESGAPVSERLTVFVRSSVQRDTGLSTPNSAPTSVKAAMARSICSGVCAAESCTRMRACPRGTTGNENPIT